MKPETVLLEDISLSGFRNLAEQRVCLSRKVNVLFGRNGQGKTNLLEAVHFLSNLRPLRKCRLHDLITLGRDKARVEGTLTIDGVRTPLAFEISNGSKEFWLGAKKVNGFKEYLGVFKTVAFSPDDMELIKGPPETRRRFIDKTAFLMNPSHLQSLSSFKLALRSRNQLLRIKSIDQLKGFTEQLAAFGAEVSRNRKAALEKISETFEGTRVDGKKVSLRFKQGWREDGREGCSALLEQIERSTQADLELGRTSPGPQRDDFDILLEDRHAAAYASQGEMRRISVEIILSLVEFLRRQSLKPLVLLDDVSSELDEQNRWVVLNAVGCLDTQVLVTTTDMEIVRPILDREHKVFEMVEGKASEL